MRGTVRGCAFYIVFHIISVFLCAMFFLSCISPVKIENDAYPAYSKGNYVFVSKRNVSGYFPGDLVLTDKGTAARIISINESFAEYSGGMFTVDGALCPQIPPLQNTIEAEKSADSEEIFSESAGGREYLIARNKIADKKIETYAVKNGEALVSIDDRRKSGPEIINLSSIKGSINGIRPILRRGNR